jgi:hypothetical protein
MPSSHGCQPVEWEPPRRNGIGVEPLHCCTPQDKQSRRPRPFVCSAPLSLLRIIPRFVSRRGTPTVSIDSSWEPNEWLAMTSEARNGGPHWTYSELCVSTRPPKFTRCSQNCTN